MGCRERPSRPLETMSSARSERPPAGVEPVAVPAALLEGFTRVWTRLAGGRWDRLETPAGPLFVHEAGDGRRDALPDRMYGLAEARTGQLETAWLPAGVPINLPPGVTAPGSEPACLGHQLIASDRAQAWAGLRRVGRQGVHKAERSGCRVEGISDADYLRLAGLKAAALAGRPPHPGLLDALRAEFGRAAAGLTGVVVKGVAVAAVLHVAVDGYGMLVDGASDRAHWDKNPNNLAVWEAVASLVDAGCARVDYGFSPIGAGDARFKDHMGGREIVLHRVVC